MLGIELRRPCARQVLLYLLYYHSGPGCNNINGPPEKNFCSSPYIHIYLSALGH